MFACDQCWYKAGAKVMLKSPQNNLNQDMKYSSYNCDHLTSSILGLTQHQRPIHEGMKDGYMKG
jgi:hypothetical protein